MSSSSCPFSYPMMTLAPSCQWIKSLKANAGLYYKCLLIYSQIDMPQLPPGAHFRRAKFVTIQGLLRDDLGTSQRFIVKITQDSKSSDPPKTETLGWEEEGKEGVQSGFLVQVFLKIGDHGYDLLFSKVKPQKKGRRCDNNRENRF